MSTIIIPERVCVKCSSITWYLRKSVRTDNYIHACNDCIKRRKIQWRIDNKDAFNLNNRIYTHENRDKRNRIQRNYRKNNPEKHTISAKKWREQNNEKWLQALRNYSNRISETLSDVYIKHEVQKLYFYTYGERITHKDVPQELIEVQRESIKLFRLLKTLTKISLNN